MKSAVAFGILKKLVAVFVKLSAAVKKVVNTFWKIIIVDKVIACVVWWIYVPTDFDTIEKALSRAKAAEKGVK